MDSQSTPIRLGLERAKLDYEIFRKPADSGQQRQRATEIDALFLESSSRLFGLARMLGNGWFRYYDERYIPVTQYSKIQQR